MLKDFKKYPATYSLLTLTLLVFLALQLVYFGEATSSLAIYNFGGMFGRAVQYDHGQIWRLISPIFVHIGWEHLIFNGVTLYFVGRIAEDLWGPGKFLILYLLAGLMGNAATLFFTPTVVSAGASTSLFGLFAAVVIVGYIGNNSVLKQVGRQFLILILLNLAFNLMDLLSGHPSISIVGHFWGLIGGGLVALFLPMKRYRSGIPVSLKITALIAYLVFSLGMIYLAIS
ncbi:rhomboid family intramembrane serine protease [Streptococcus downei]|uniref:Rhomboid family membrane protein n=1 Tax=Streptococcus downei MFe28 TaxID=764290 RepID=A0A380JB84_STRDO|nr:rhomboid family intramembrane serine protease [Streptococcus downei]EFQ58272.1 peptidase, S54 family [Streptococcus downei F0415]SUN35271.1 rhomboid family membrane protein [Streptococcus downei MFe28]